MQLQAILLRFYTDAQWTNFPSFCQRCYSSLTELLTEMGHYTEAIKRYLTIIASSQKKANAISKFGVKRQSSWCRKLKILTRVPMQSSSTIGCTILTGPLPLNLINNCSWPSTGSGTQDLGRGPKTQTEPIVELNCLPLVFRPGGEKTLAWMTLDTGQYY